MTQTEESRLASKQGFFYTGFLGIGLAALGVEVGPSPWTAWLSEFPARVVEELTYRS